VVKLEMGHSWREGSSWLLPGLIVRVLDSSLLNGKYYRAKGQVKRLIDETSAELIMNDPSLPPIGIDFRSCETVIPALNSIVMIVIGAQRGQQALLLNLSDDQQSATIECLDVERTRLSDINLSDICKYSSALS